MKELLISLLFIFAINSYAGLAKISKIHGEVLVNNQPGKIEQVLNVGDVLVAKTKKSFFVVEYQNGTRFMLKHGVLKIVSLSDLNDTVELKKGTIFSRVKKSITGNINFSVKTAKASMGVRGTEFFILEDEKESYLCVCDGSVEVRKNLGGAVLVEKGEDIHVVDGKELLKLPASKQMMSMGNEIFSTF